MKALYVENNDGTRDFMVESLCKAGVDVRGVKTAAEALESIKADPPDVLILDWFLDDHDGDWVVSEMRRLALGPDTTVVAATALPEKVHAGIPCLKKPFVAAELVELVKRVGERLCGG